jgi:hypothetical protein
MLDAHPDSTIAKARRRAADEARRREERRQRVIDALRRARDEKGDPVVRSERERAERHQEVLERWPPLW